MSYSAGLLKVGTLNVPGASGSVTATNINATNISTTNLNSSNLSVVGNNLTVNGNISVTGNVLINNAKYTTTRPNTFKMCVGSCSYFRNNNQSLYQSAPGFNNSVSTAAVFGIGSACLNDFINSMINQNPDMFCHLGDISYGGDEVCGGFTGDAVQVTPWSDDLCTTLKILWGYQDPSGNIGPYVNSVIDSLRYQYNYYTDNDKYQSLVTQVETPYVLTDKINDPKIMNTRGGAHYIWDDHDFTANDQTGGKWVNTIRSDFINYFCNSDKNFMQYPYNIPSQQYKNINRSFKKVFNNNGTDFVVKFVYLDMQTTRTSSGTGKFRVRGNTQIGGMAAYNPAINNAIAYCIKDSSGDYTTEVTAPDPTNNPLKPDYALLFDDFDTYYTTPVTTRRNFFTSTLLNWLVDELSEPGVDLKIISQGRDGLFYPGTGAQSICEFPGARREMIERFRAAQIDKFVVLGGDFHRSGVFRYDDILGTPIYEIMSSGITFGSSRNSSLYSTVPGMSAYLDYCPFKGLTGRDGSGNIQNFEPVNEKWYWAQSLSGNTGAFVPAGLDSYMTLDLTFGNTAIGPQLIVTPNIKIKRISQLWDVGNTGAGITDTTMIGGQIPFSKYENWKQPSDSYTININNLKLDTSANPTNVPVGWQFDTSSHVITDLIWTYQFKDATGPGATATMRNYNYEMWMRRDWAGENTYSKITNITLPMLTGGQYPAASGSGWSIGASPGSNQFVLGWDAYGGGQSMWNYTYNYPNYFANKAGNTAKMQAFKENTLAGQMYTTTAACGRVGNTNSFQVRQYNKDASNNSTTLNATLFETSGFQVRMFNNSLYCNKFCVDTGNVNGIGQTKGARIQLQSYAASAASSYAIGSCSTDNYFAAKYNASVGLSSNRTVECSTLWLKLHSMLFGIPFTNNMWSNTTNGTLGGYNVVDECLMWGNDSTYKLTDNWRGFNFNNTIAAQRLAKNGITSNGGGPGNPAPSFHFMDSSTNGLSVQTVFTDASCQYLYSELATQYLGVTGGYYLPLPLNIKNTLLNYPTLQSSITIPAINTPIYSKMYTPFNPTEQTNYIKALLRLEREYIYWLERTYGPTDIDLQTGPMESDNTYVIPPKLLPTQ